MVYKRVAALAVLFCSANLWAQEMFGDDKKTFVLLPAETISSGVVSQIEFSQSGRYITYRKTDIDGFEARMVNKDLPAKTSWYRYDRTTKVNLRMPVPETAQEVLFLGDDQTIYFTGSKAEDAQGFVNLKNGATTKTNFDVAALQYVGELAWAPYFMFNRTDRELVLAWPNGQSLVINVPPKMSIFRPLKSDGQNLAFSAMVKGDQKSFGRLIYSMNDRATTFKSLTHEEWSRDMRSDEKPLNFWFEDTADMCYVKLRSLPKTLVTDLPTLAKLSTVNCVPTFGPGNDCVAYLDAGALLIRDIKPIDSAVARKVLADAAKAKAISDSKQAALGLIVYASDNDGVLPGAEGWEHKVEPYFKNVDLLKNFNYTFRGGTMESISNPAETELGFTIGPGGRAVAYCDGQVKWVSNP
jgi:hypothetical protein